MSYELTQRFFFEAAHTLSREVEAEGSRRMHGHTYYAELTVSGRPDPRTGMVMDLARLRALAQHARERLDHRLLNEVEGLGPPTLENLCAYLWRRFEAEGCAPSRVVVRREGMGDSCSLTAEPGEQP
jgi:6-pyruvoyltetrahydropterin/6-carboxytetrahydropterin synthase